MHRRRSFIVTFIGLAMLMAVSSSVPVAAQSKVEIAVPGYEALDGALDKVIFASTSSSDDLFDLACIEGVVDHPYARAVVLDRDGRQAGLSTVVANEIVFEPGSKVLDLVLVDSCIDHGVEYFVYEGFVDF